VRSDEDSSIEKTIVVTATRLNEAIGLLTAFAALFTSMVNATIFLYVWHYMVGLKDQ